MPDYLATFNKNVTAIPSTIIYKNFDLHYVPHIIANQAVNLTKPPVKIVLAEDEESKEIGILLAVKALVQLICNPIVGNLSNVFGYKILIFMGTIFLLTSSTCKYLI